MSQKSGPASHTFDNDNSKWAKKQQQTKKNKKKTEIFNLFYHLLHTSASLYVCVRVRFVITSVIYSITDSLYPGKLLLVALRLAVLLLLSLPQI